MWAPASVYWMAWANPQQPRTGLGPSHHNGASEPTPRLGVFSAVARREQAAAPASSTSNERAGFGLSPSLSLSLRVSATAHMSRSNDPRAPRLISPGCARRLAGIRRRLGRPLLARVFEPRRLLGRQRVQVPTRVRAAPARPCSDLVVPMRVRCPPQAGRRVESTRNRVPRVYHVP